MNHVEKVGVVMFGRVVTTLSALRKVDGSHAVAHDNHACGRDSQDLYNGHELSPEDGLVFGNQRSISVALVVGPDIERPPSPFEVLGQRVKHLAIGVNLNVQDAINELRAGALDVVRDKHVGPWNVEDGGIPLNTHRVALE